jgi:hypothetical protein
MPSLLQTRFGMFSARADRGRPGLPKSDFLSITSDRQRVEFLFALYERFTAPLLPVEKKGRRRGHSPK